MQAIGRQLGAITQTNPHFGLTCKLEGYKSLSDGKGRREMYWGKAIVKLLTLVPILHFL